MNMNSFGKFSVIVLLFTFLLVAALSPLASAQDQTADQTLLAEIQKIPLISDSNVTVRVKNGEVTLTGEASSEFDSAEIEEILFHKDGVRSVKNYLIVSTLNIKPDRKLANAVTKALGNSLDFSDRNIHVEAKDGVVTLSGSVPSTAEKEIVESVTRHTKGVKDVRNLITTAAG